MMTLLIVDDEVIIADGLSQTLQEAFHDRLIVRRCYSARDAKEIILKNRIDILITDINMPNTTGIELHKWIADRWPRTRVIYLTGYTDFQYAMEALNNHVMAFILKSDGDQKLIDAVENTILDIEKEDRRLLDGTREDDESPIRLQQLIFHGLYGGTVIREQIRDALAGEKEGIDPDEKFCLGYCFFKEPIRPHSSVRVARLIRHLTGKKLSLITVELTSGCFALLYQPVRQEDTDLLCGNLEMVQELLKQEGQSLSACILKDPMDWPELSDAGDQLLKTANRYSLSDGELILLRKEQMELEKHTETAEKTMSDAMTGVRRLHDYLLTGQRDLFFEEEASMWRILETLEANTASEIYSAMVSCLNNDCCSLENNRDALELMETLQEQDPSYPERNRELFHELAERYFGLRKENQSNRLKKLTDRVDSFIMENLFRDISLTMIADTFHFHPSYLSRVYKETTGVSVSDSIAAKRLIRVKALLRSDEYSIAAIAAMTGFTSANYFSRWFRKWTGITPQEFRENG